MLSCVHKKKSKKCTTAVDSQGNPPTQDNLLRSHMLLVVHGQLICKTWTKDIYMKIYPKELCGPSLDIYLTWTPIFEWCVVRLDMETNT